MLPMRIADQNLLSAIIEKLTMIRPTGSAQGFFHNNRGLGPAMLRFTQAYLKGPPGIRENFDSPRPCFHE